MNVSIENGFYYVQEVLDGVILSPVHVAFVRHAIHWSSKTLYLDATTITERHGMTGWENFEGSDPQFIILAAVPAYSVGVQV